MQSNFCRVFGSLKIHECIKLRDAYDRLKFGGPSNSKTLEQNLRSALSKGNFQQALLDLIIADPLNNPLGSYLEVVDEDLEASKEGERAKKLAETNYRQEKVIAKGDALLIAKQRGKLVATDGAEDKAASELGNQKNSYVYTKLLTKYALHVYFL